VSEETSLFLNLDVRSARPRTTGDLGPGSATTKLKLILTTAIAAAGVGGLLADHAAAALPSACTHSGRTVTCSYTSGSNPFTVPAGVFSIHVLAVGGRGSGSQFDTGGSGALVSGDLPVNARGTLYAVVGTNGGGASDVRTSQDDLSTRLLVAGGGGSDGGYGIAVLNGQRLSFSPGGLGGTAGNANDADGGGGGSTSGGAGGVGGTFCLNISPFPPVCATSGSGSAGTFGYGGSGGYPGNWTLGDIVGFAGGGGSGGDGWFGGGGGAGGVGYSGGGGGGGGSNLVPPGGSQSVDTTGIPRITISYVYGRPQG
jgi:hypothetical protein